MQFYSIYKFSKILGVTSQTVRNWDRDGKLKPHHITTNGHRYYSEEQLNQVIGKRNPDARKVIGYCRVSSAKQKAELARYTEILTEKLSRDNRPYEIIQDIGSEYDYCRKGLNTILEQVESDIVAKVVVPTYDTLLDSGYNFFVHIAKRHGCEVICLPGCN